MKTYKEVAGELAELVEIKQKAYGDAFGKNGKIMKILYPEGIPLDKLEDALTVVRVLDKLSRIATDKDALGESPWRDIMGYALLAVTKQENATPKSLLEAIADNEANPGEGKTVYGPGKVTIDPMHTLFKTDLEDPFKTNVDGLDMTDIRIGGTSNCACDSPSCVECSPPTCSCHPVCGCG